MKLFPLGALLETSKDKISKVWQNITKKNEVFIKGNRLNWYASDEEI
jgi:hypothetical protein